MIIMLQIANYFLILYVPVTEYISEISTRDKHRQIYKLFVHIYVALYFFICAYLGILNVWTEMRIIFINL